MRAASRYILYGIGMDMKGKYLFLDCETAGTDISYSLLTFSLAVTTEDFKVINTLDLSIRPENGVYRADPSALAINKINLSDHYLQSSSSKDAREYLESYLSSYAKPQRLTPVGHNLHFDLGFINQFYSNWSKFCSHRCIDTCSLAAYLQMQKKIPANNNLSLAQLCAHFKIDSSKHHNAKEDVKLTIQVLAAMNRIKLS